MDKKLDFRLMYKLKDKAEVETQVQRLNEQPESAFEIDQIEPYMTSQPLFECCLKANPAGKTKEECVFNTLLKAQSISTEWEVNGPLQNGMDTMIFEGVFYDNSDENPLKWAHFILVLNEP